MEPKCKTCGDSGMVRIYEPEEPLDYYWFCGCRYHKWCPDCTWRITRWLDRLYLFFNPVS